MKNFAESLPNIIISRRDIQVCVKTSFECCFWPGLGLPRPKAVVVIPKINSSQTIYGKKRVIVRSTPGHYATTKRSVEITMHLGLDNIIKLKLTTNFHTSAILNVLTV